MNIAELRRMIAAAGIRPDALDDGGQHSSECFVVAKRGGEWVAYYAERGLESGRVHFLTEDAACNHVLAQLTTGR